MLVHGLHMHSNGALVTTYKIQKIKIFFKLARNYSSYIFNVNRIFKLETLKKGFWIEFRIKEKIIEKLFLNVLYEARINHRLKFPRSSSSIPPVLVVSTRKQYGGTKLVVSNGLLLTSMWKRHIDSDLKSLWCSARSF